MLAESYVSLDLQREPRVPVKEVGHYDEVVQRLSRVGALAAHLPCNAPVAPTRHRVQERGHRVVSADDVFVV